LNNVGAAQIKGYYLVFFDGDALLPSPHVLAQRVARLEADPGLAYTQPHIADPDSGVTLRRWVPRL
jgi:hypothetical protein